MVLAQNWPFFRLFFLRNIGQKNVFNAIREPRNALLSYKNKKFKKSKNWHFFKGVNPWFWPKNGHFSNFSFLGNIAPENVFNDILGPKNAFLNYKNNKFKQSKNWHFSKGLNQLFLPKISHFSNFCFLRQCNPGKCLSRYSRTKTRLSKL